ncbi:MAG: invasion associated locus B family protein [Pseudorhodobacter sp.]
MTVSKKPFLLSTLLAVAISTSALAQSTETPVSPPEATTEAPAAEAPAPGTISESANPNGLSMGTEEGQAEDGIGSTYTAATHGDWEQRCVRTEDGADPCQLYQLLQDDEENPVAEISIFGLPDGQQAAAGATVIVPLETLLTSALSMVVDGGKARTYPFSWCSQIGCIARIGFTAAEIEAFKKGNKAEITIVPVVAPDEKVTVAISLAGFTAGYDAVNEANKPAGE